MVAGKDLTPRQIVQELDKYIIGQVEAKKNVAIALRNKWRRKNADDSIRDDIVQNNILMIGNTGVGKTEIARRLAKIIQAPFIKVEASKFTEVGYVGRDVEGMVRDLVEQSVIMVKAMKKDEVKERALRIVEETLLNYIIPDIKNLEGGVVPLNMVDLRESYRSQLRHGELDDRIVEIKIKQSANPNLGVMGAGGSINESAMMGLTDILSSVLPEKSRKKKVTVAQAKKMLLDEESSKLLDMDDVNDLALELASNGFIFIDEIDKIATPGSKKGGIDVSREGVQRDLLPIIEGCAVTTKYGVVHTDHILFIAAGAFHLSKPSDLIPELQGRLPIRVELEKLTVVDFIRILKEPKASLIKQYQALLAAEGVSIEFADDAVETIAELASQANEEVENIGARRLHTVLSYLLKDYLYDIPDQIVPGESIKITVDIVKKQLSSLVKSPDFNQYII